MPRSVRKLTISSAKSGLPSAFSVTCRASASGKSLDPEPRLYQAANVACRKWLQTQLGDGRAVEPRRRIFRAARGEEQKPQLCFAIDDLAQQFLGYAVDPVQILDHHDHWREAAARLQQLLQKLARAQADQHAVESRQAHRPGL